MLRKLVFILMTGIIFGLPLASAHAFELISGPTELIYYDSTKTYDGLTGWGEMNWGSTNKINNPFMLIDMYGRLVHYIPGGAGGQLLPNGNICTSGQGGLTELDWWGNQQFPGIPLTGNEPAAAGSYPYSQHHDTMKIWNKALQQYTYCMIAHETRPQSDALAMGMTSANVPASGFDPDVILEFTQGGTLVWKWGHGDHFVQTTCPTCANYVSSLALAPGRINIYISGNQPGTDMFHSNSFDYNPDLGYFCINSRGTNETYVVDHDGTFVSTSNWAANFAAARGPAGDVLYRFGDPANYSQGTAQGAGGALISGNRQLWGAHDAHWNRPTFYTDNFGPSPTGPPVPGAGHMMFHDNGCTNNNPLKARSSYKEINPYISGAAVGGVYPTASHYVNPPDAGYTAWPANAYYNAEAKSNQIVWRWYPKTQTSHNNPGQGSGQRLPNGNTMIESAVEGHFFELAGGTNPDDGEVTDTGGQVVWEYISPWNWGVAQQSTFDLDWETPVPT